MALYIFAAARDGDMLLASVTAGSDADARDAALATAKEHHSLECDHDEIESCLDGFDIQPAENFRI